MSVIVGLNAFHADSSVCLVIDGKLVSAISEERLGDRLKHSPRFPEQAFRRVLKEGGVRLRDVTHVALARDSRANLQAKMKYVAARPFRSMGAVAEHLRRSNKTQRLLDQLAEICGEDPATVKFETVNVEHHLAHIASAYYLSPFDTLTAGFSYDASGDFVSCMAARCEGTQIEPLHRVYLPHSLGFFYTALCQFIGFDDFGEEYKVMGLNAYGEDEYADVMKRLVLTDEQNWFKLAPGYFGMHEGGESGALDATGRLKMGPFYTDALLHDLGEPRKREEPITEREKNIARSTQLRFEEIASFCFKKLHEMVPTNQLAMAGGAALNGVMNARIHRETPFQKHYLQAASSDDGTCIGAAYWCYHNIIGGRERFHMEHAYWGPSYGEQEHRAAADAAGCPLEVLPDDDALFERVAQLLYEGKVIGWYQDGSEWGPRALGNRSILANPAHQDMKDIINAKVKRRESFRPFAPTVLEESVATYFEQDIKSPFMMHVVKFRPEWRDKLPAVTHVDGTGRLQTLARQQNQKYYDLIKAFSKLSGVDILLNTSFNENEPIVDTPQQAVNCFKRTDMDALCLGNYLLEKSPQAGH